MAKIPFFDDGPANDPAYVNTRDLDNHYARSARENCRALWEIYEPHADREFLTEIKSNFDARYWEMYLTTVLISKGYDVTCPKPGPDAGIKFDDQRIWFEATSPTRGADGAPDQVPEMQDGVVQDVPNEKMVLRYLNSISEKFYRQYASWLKQKIVEPTDAFVIAINPRRLGFEHWDTQPPRILQVAFAIGSPLVAIDRNTMKVVRSTYEFRDKIEKSSGAAVPTGVFQQDEYRGLSALLCSRVDVVNQPEDVGADFQLVPNPSATSPLPRKFRLKGTYFRIDRTNDGYVAIPETS